MLLLNGLSMKKWAASIIGPTSLLPEIQIVELLILRIQNFFPLHTLTGNLSRRWDSSSFHCKPLNARMYWTNFIRMFRGRYFDDIVSLTKFEIRQSKDAIPYFNLKALRKLTSSSIVRTAKAFSRRITKDMFQTLLGLLTSASSVFDPFRRVKKCITFWSAV